MHWYAKQKLNTEVTEFVTANYSELSHIVKTALVDLTNVDPDQEIKQSILARWGQRVLKMVLLFAVTYSLPIEQALNYVLQRQQAGVQARPTSSAVVEAKWVPFTQDLGVLGKAEGMMSPTNNAGYCSARIKIPGLSIMPVKFLVPRLTGLAENFGAKDVKVHSIQETSDNFYHFQVSANEFMWAGTLKVDGSQGTVNLSGFNSKATPKEQEIAESMK